MSLFGKKGDRAADGAAATAEVDRLTALSAHELGSELLPAFGPGGAPAKGGRTAPMQIIQWLMASYRGANLKPLVPAVMAGLQDLETTGLLTHTTSGTGSGGQQFYLTTAGEQALAGGASGAPPA